jgi:hypothetical protein
MLTAARVQCTLEALDLSRKPMALPSALEWFVLIEFGLHDEE